jgi:hypothetical protein
MLQVVLCSDCDRYLTVGSKVGFWPAMIWSFLSNGDVASSGGDIAGEPVPYRMSLEEKWKLIPQRWRGWWLHAVNANQISLDNPKPQIEDVTVERNELLAALASLVWKRIAPAMDKYLAVPTVRCPWGCGSYMHKTNEVPFEEFLLVRSNFAFKSSLQGNLQRRKWVDSIRPDYPRSTEILENGSFLCRPCLILKENGPFLLCCSKHDASTVHRIVHVPRNPTGALFTDASNQYAPLVIKSRTIMKAKFNTYSDTYKTVEMQGAFDGIDSAYCSRIGNRRLCNNLSRQRDCIGLVSRDDVRHSFQMLCESSHSATYLPKNNVDELLEEADMLYSEKREEIFSHLDGATYVSVENAMSMQECAYNSTALSLLITDGTAPDLFEPPWPAVMIRVHPYDKHGERFTSVKVPGRSSDDSSFHIWCLVCSILCVDEIWNALSTSMTTDCDDKGFLMALAWQQRKKDVGRNSTKNTKYFNLKDSFPGSVEGDETADDVVKTVKDLSVGMCNQDSANACKFPTASNNETICSAVDVWDPEEFHCGVECVFFSFADSVNASLILRCDANDKERYFLSGASANQSTEVQGWEPVCIITKNTESEHAERTWNGNVYARHGCQNLLRSWWFMKSKNNNPFVRLPSDTSFGVSNVKVIVFKRASSFQAASVSALGRYSKFLGGQTAVFCSLHNFPLIFAYQGECLKCCCSTDLRRGHIMEWTDCHERCSRSAKYRCSSFGCDVAICSKDFGTFCENINDSAFYIGLTTCHRRADISETNGFGGTDSNSAGNCDYSANFSTGGERESTHFYTSDSSCADSGGDSDSIMINASDDDLSYDFSERGSFAGGSIRYQHNSEMGPTTGNDVGNGWLYDGDDESENDEEGHISSDRPRGQLPLSLSNADEVLNVKLELPFDLNTNENLSIPLHVLLNRQGHLLIRRNAKLRPCLRHKAFLQRFVSRSKGRCIPLLYAESSLFPDIFYYGGGEGEIAGALPTAFWTDKSTLSRYGVASMRTHATIRINDPALLTSTDSRYHFLTMDALVNLGLRGQDSRLLLHRGFAESQDKNEGIVARTEEGYEELYDDTVDNSANVHKLSRLCADDPAHLFYTQSCNQSSAKALGILRKWVVSNEAVNCVMKKYQLCREEASSILRASAAPFVQSTWNVFIDVWMNYIINSPEEPLGRVDWAWIRKEFQDHTGNVSHIHCILKLFYDATTEHGLAQILDKIRGAVADLVRWDEVSNLVEAGALESKDCLIEILQQAVQYLSHKCGPRCMIVKKDDNGKDYFVCKRPFNWLLTNNPGVHSMEEVKVAHTTTALEILKEVGFAEDDHNSETIRITNPQLHMIRHIPKCCKSDGKFSATNGKLFCMFPSASNLQFANGHCLAAYITAYMTDVDKVATIHLHAPTKRQPDTVRGKYESLNNTKIKSVKFHHEQRLAAKKTKVPLGRPVTQMEALTVINGEPLVRTTREFINLQTSPRELRAAVAVPYLSTSCRPEDLQAVLAVTAQTARLRKKFTSNRLFSPIQLVVIRDELAAPLRTDRITHFSMRPPELLFIDNCVLYTKWFVRHRSCPLFSPKKSLDFLRKHLQVDESKSYWMDGFNYQLKVRWAAIGSLWNFAKNRYENDTNAAAKPSRHLLHLLGKLDWMKNGYQQTAQYVYTRNTLDEFEFLLDAFVCEKAKRSMPVVWWSPIHPRRRTAFLVHLLLCMGHFTTEYELMLSGNLRESFVKARLIRNDDGVRSLHDMLRCWTIDHLRVIPGSQTYQFDRNLSDAFVVLKELIFPTAEPQAMLGTPSVLYSTIIRDTDKKVLDFIKARRQEYISAIYSELSKCNLLHVVPSPEEVLGARKDRIATSTINEFFPPPKNDSQSDDSYEEQCHVMLQLKKTIDLYISGIHTHRNVILVGGPGVGKTTVSVFCSLYCLCIGLNGIATSLVADRSKALGGLHLHRLLGLTARDDNVSSGRKAELALQHLYAFPEKLGLIRALDFINVDEVFVLGGQYLSILDMVARYTRKDSRPFGGIFLLGTGDELQLLPFDGPPIMLSLYVVTDFSFFRLKESVRAARDSILRELIGLTRTLKWTRTKKNRFAAILRDHGMFLQNWEDPTIPEDAVFVFSRKEPCAAAELVMIDLMKRRYEGIYRTVDCHDEESTTGGNWHHASEATSRRLDRKIKQRRQIVLYPKAKFEFTQISPGNFNQGQLALLVDVPSDEDIERKLPLRLYAGPSGEKSFPHPEECDSGSLIQKGWKLVSVCIGTSRNETILRGVQARRTQYPIKPRVSSTIHSCMGATLSAVVTAVVPSMQMPYNFGLWEAAQVVVLLSRTRTLDSLFFVGDREDTIKHLLDVLSGQQNRYISFITSLLDKLCGEHFGEIHILPQPTMFRPIDSPLPRTSGVYSIVSMRQPNYAYIGQSINLAKRLEQHNCLQGPSCTAHLDLVPFAMHAYVVGFENRSQREEFEAIWKITNVRRHNISLNNNGRIQVALDLINEWNVFRLRHGHIPLRLVQCGSVVQTINS